MSVSNRYYTEKRRISKSPHSIKKVSSPLLINDTYSTNDKMWM